MNNSGGSGRVLSTFLKILVWLCAVITFSVLIFLVVFILVKGVGHLKPSLFAWEYTSDNVSLIPAAVNTVIMVVLTLVIAVPIGVFSAIFLVEYPAAVPGILAGVILSTGRIVGETAALIFTAGTMARIPSSLLGSGRTLALHMYVLSSEALHMNEAYATAVVLLLLVLFINGVSNVIAGKLTKV